MRKTLVAIVAAALLSVAVVPTSQASTQPSDMAFGMDAYSIKAQVAAGVKPDYATLWVGPWNLDGGWSSVDAQLEKLRQAGVTPVIHLYYWGDDISPTCVKNGCWSDLHGVRKDKDGWDRLTRQLVNHLDQKMWGREVVIVVETEFNKGSMVGFEGFDWHLARKADYLHANYANAHVVLGLGNWNSGDWSTWDRGAAASDAIGLQAMRGSTRDSDGKYRNAFEQTLSGARTAKALFGKPVFITDVALSSYPSSTHSAMQAAELKEFFANMPALKKAGVQAIVYRSWKNTDMDDANYYGKAEDHWGLHWKGGAEKPAAKVWIRGVKAERGEITLRLDLEPRAKANNNWQEVAVSSNLPVWKVQVKDDGQWKGLPKTSPGIYAKDIHIANGQTVQYRAIASTGETVYSGTYVQT